MSMTQASPYQHAIEYVESFISGPAIIPGLSREQRLETMRARLPRLRYLLQLLGDPHRRYSFLHVGGTSGKGSTSAMLAAVLQAAGHRTGLHTTPYLQSPREKLIVDGRWIAPQEFARLVESCRPAIETMQAESPLGPPSYSEIWLALTLAYFAQAQVDVTVLEVVAGGRYDFTNLVEPLVAVITTVHYDHTLVLGESLAEIAWHKAGIVKKGIPLVTAVQQPDLLEILRRECQHQAAPLFQVGKHTRYKLRSLDLDGGRFDFYGLDGRLWPNLHVAMLGEHQVSNAATALTALQVTQRFGRLDLSERAIREGLEQARFPGRLEIVQRRPLVVLDGAHNPEKMGTLRRALEALFPDRRLILVLGVIAAKDFANVVSTIAPLADQIITTTAQVVGKEPVDPKEIAHLVRKQGFPENKVLSEPDPLEAMERALASAGPEDLVCVTGSLYLVGQVRERWTAGELGNWGIG